MQRLGKHIKGCRACREVQHRRKRTVWMTPQLEAEKVFFVCADPCCKARLQIVNLATLSLPSL
jgi:hypothetical protein